MIGSDQLQHRSVTVTGGNCKQAVSVSAFLNFLKLKVVNQYFFNNNFSYTYSYSSNKIITQSKTLTKKSDVAKDWIKVKGEIYR